MPWYTQSYEFSLLEVNGFVLNTVFVLHYTVHYTPSTWYDHIVKGMLPDPFRDSRDGTCMYCTPPPQKQVTPSVTSVIQFKMSTKMFTFNIFLRL